MQSSGKEKTIPMNVVMSIRRKQALVEWTNKWDKRELVSEIANETSHAIPISCYYYYKTLQSGKHTFNNSLLAVYIRLHSLYREN